MMPDVLPELRPFFDYCFILGFGICSGCGREQEFSSEHPQFSDGWWLDEAAAMHKAGWLVSGQLDAWCPECQDR